LVGCGNARPGTEIRIVDPEALVTLPERCVGEIWVASQSVAQGYWRQPEASEASFRARTAEGDGPLLRTGDLGYLAGRELFVTGRIKDLLIIRGRNLYPHDLEDTVAAASPAIRPGCIAVFPIEREGEEKVAVVAEVDPTAGAALEGHAIIRSLIERISAAHEVRPALVVLAKKGTVPKTPSGKLQRRLCKQLLGAGELDPIASWDERDGAL
jgi:acyl-CoA synthetase (AMP-forming)/AMP-acid ligase II